MAQEDKDLVKLTRAINDLHKMTRAINDFDRTVRSFIKIAEALNENVVEIGRLLKEKEAQ